MDFFVKYWERIAENKKWCCGSIVEAYEKISGVLFSVFSPSLSLNLIPSLSLTIFTSISFYLSICLTLYLSLSLSIYIYIYIYIYLYLYISLSIYINTAYTTPHHA